MRIIACVIWYDESLDDLRTMAESLRGFADGMVAVDGAFAEFPVGQKATPFSYHEQAAVLLEACAGHIELMLYQPTQAGEWPSHTGNEVEKRNASLRMAGLMGADWVFNCDADMILEEAGSARIHMAATDRDVVISDVEGNPTKHVYRYTPGLMHHRSHWIVVNERGMLSGPPPGKGIGDYPRLLPALDLRDILLFGHPERTDYWRRVRQTSWYDIRDGERAIEKW